MIHIWWRSGLNRNWLNDFNSIIDNFNNNIPI